MSKQALGAFMAKVEEDESLREELKALARDDRGAPVEAIADLARSKGFDFTVEDVSAASRSELSEEELASVSGGASGFSLNFNKITQKVYPDLNGSLFLKFS
jgi:predicted ribosomally synthesized peptide with nif11-like leader